MIEGTCDQMMKNASLLAIDMWDGYAAKYQQVPTEGRAEFMDQTVVEFLKTMESFNPNGPRDISDEKRLEELGPRTARPERGAIGTAFCRRTGADGGLHAERDGRFAAPQTQTCAVQLMRDMTWHLRGQDIATGKPVQGGGK